MKLWAQQWFAKIWADPQLRLRVAGEYHALAASKHLLADIAIRNYVFTAAPDAGDLFAAGTAEGRRRAALEIFDLARIDPRELGDVTVRLAQRGDTDG